MVHGQGRPDHRGVSADQNGRLEAWDRRPGETVNRIARERGSEIASEFVEHESGANNERPKLDKAMRHARWVGALLVVAKRDRLARDFGFMMRLYDADVSMLFRDLPEIYWSVASRQMVQMMANIAEYERRWIEERTREALAQLDLRGTQVSDSGLVHHTGSTKLSDLNVDRTQITMPVDQRMSGGRSPVWRPNRLRRYRSKVNSRDHDRLNEQTHVHRGPSIAFQRLVCRCLAASRIGP
jgi:hypothetical protein